MLPCPHPATVFMSLTAVLLEPMKRMQLCVTLACP